MINDESSEIVNSDVDYINVYCWGYGKYGQIGKKFINFSLKPIFIDIDPSEEVFLLAGGEFQTAILTLSYETSKLYLMGKNSNGQLGIDNNNNNYIYFPVYNNISNRKIVKVSCGGDHTLLLTQENELFSYGVNIFGQLGIDTFNSSSNPKQVNFKELIIDISAGSQHSLILSQSFGIYTCGYSKNGSLGYNSIEDVCTFTKVEGIKIIEKIDKISSGVFHSACIFDGQNIIIWGIGQVMKFDKPTIISFSDIHKKINVDLKDIKIGEDFIYVLNKNDELYCMGDNSFCQLGTKNNSSNSFIKLNSKLKFKQIEVGYNFVLAISQDNNVYGWGSNEYGQLTLNSTNIVEEPTLIEELTNLGVFKIAAGGYHAMGIFSVNNSNNIITMQNLNKNEIYDHNINEYKKLVKQTMLCSTMRNDLVNHRDRAKLVDFIKNNISEKLNLLKNKDNTIKDLKHAEDEIKKTDSSNTNVSKFAHLTRGFDNTFEISIEEIIFDEKGEIGRGTFGEVRKGYWRKEIVAVKFLKDDMVNNDESIATFVEECNMLKNLRHPNILLFMGACIEPPILFVMTEFCDNGNLFELLHQRRSIPINWEERKRIKLEIAIGMNYLHSFNPPILHRDLKSMNVLLDKNNQVKIADFGSTKFLEVHMTKHKGTFQWMAPEVIKESTYTEKADIFSFGVVMAEIATRVPPYYGIDKKEVATNVLNRPDYRPSVDKSSVPREYYELMKKCWEHSPSKRPSFSDIIDILNKIKIK